MAVAARLAEYRVRAGLTQKRVAAELSVSSSTIIQWENGHTYPTSRDLLKLADLYGIHAGQFFGLPLRAATSSAVIDEIITLAKTVGIDPVAFVVVDGDMSSLTYAEQMSELLEHYRALPPEFQEYLRSMAKALAKIAPTK